MSENNPQPVSMIERLMQLTSQVGDEPGKPPASPPPVSPPSPSVSSPPPPVTPVVESEKPVEPEKEEPESPQFTKLAAPPKKGKKKGRPKTLSDEPRQATQIFLTENERLMASTIGEDGKMADGIRKALLFFCEKNDLTV